MTGWGAWMAGCGKPCDGRGTYGQQQGPIHADPRVLEGLGDLLAEGERLVDRGRSLLEAIDQRRPLAQL